jgi:tRNA G18 (ribose-2'-O)-methylase SpoU
VGIVLGNEGDGLPEEIMAELDDTVRIPMTGTAESLNLGIAAGVLMYEVQRRRIG